jgi:hypothetical protein
MPARGSGTSELTSLSRFEAFIRPPDDVAVTSFGTAQTGITAAMLEEAPPAGAVMEPMHGDRLAHSPACSRHPVTADCPVDCLAPLLPSRIPDRLARADGRHGEQAASCGTPATVGDVVRLHRQGRVVSARSAA